MPFQWGIDTPEIGSHAKCIKERKLALIAKGRLKKLLEQRGLRIEIKGYDNTPKHRALINIYRTNGEEIGAKLLDEGFAREWLRTARMIGARISVRGSPRPAGE